MVSRRNKIFLAAMAYFTVTAFTAMMWDHWIRWPLAASGVLFMLGYMAWSIRDSKNQNWMPPDPPLGRGPDPFLSGRRRSGQDSSASLGKPGSTDPQEPQP